MSDGHDDPAHRAGLGVLARARGDRPHPARATATSCSSDGGWRPPEGGAYEPTINPATEEPLAEIAQAGDADVDAAVAAAREALPRWQKLPALERGKYVFRIARLIQERARELAIVESLDGGKPIRESRDVDIPLAAAHFFYYAGWADKLALRPRRPRASSRWASSARSCRGTSRC